MPRKRYIKQDQDSFFGHYLYDQLIPKNHFYRKLNEMIDWERFTQALTEFYKGGGEFGRPPYDPALVLKMLFVSYLYNLSERQTEIYVNENVPAKYFVGLAIDKPAPDHSTLTYFKKRLIRNGNLDVFESMLSEIIRIAMERGSILAVSRSLTVFIALHMLIQAKMKRGKRRAMGLEIQMPNGVLNMNASSRPQTAKSRSKSNISMATKLM